MSRPATSRLKVNPPVGTLPVLQYCAPDQLQIDPEYQRSLETGGSQTLIRRLAVFWDWGLCQPLVVARRADSCLYVVDGQHRLAAAKLRGDIWQLPCVVASYRNPAEEAAAFVALNQQRRPLSALNLFHAALAAEDEEACAIARLITGARLSLSPHSNHTAWKPRMVSNIGGIRQAYRMFGADVTSAALVAISSAFDDQILQFAGTIFLPIARCYSAFLKDESFDPDLFIDVIAGATQKDWVQEIHLEKATSGAHLAAAGEAVFTRAYREAAAE
jgi:hypothetical protein